MRENRRSSGNSYITDFKLERLAKSYSRYFQKKLNFFFQEAKLLKPINTMRSG